MDTHNRIGGRHLIPVHVFVYDIAHILNHLNMKNERKRMKMKKWALCMGIVALFAGLCAPLANADLYCETENVSTNVPTQPDGTSILKYYFSHNAWRLQLGDSKVFIVDYNAHQLYTLDIKSKTFTELNLNELPGLPGVAAGDKKKISEMLGAMMETRITPTNELKTIAGYKCRKFNVRIAIVNGEYWVSKDVRGYRELKDLGAKVGTIAERNPMLRQLDVPGMVEKLDGFPVFTVNHVLGGTVASTLKKIEQKSLDPALFTVPKDYAMKKGK
jgi:hypothetical protein